MTISDERFREMQHADSAYYDSTPDEREAYWARIRNGEPDLRRKPTKEDYSFEDGYMTVTIKARFKVSTVSDLQSATDSIEKAIDELNGYGECLNSTIIVPKLELKA